MSDLNIMVQDDVLVREILHLAEKVIKVALKIKRVTKEHIASWKKVYKDAPTNGPPSLGIAVNDSAGTKDVFGG